LEGEGREGSALEKRGLGELEDFDEEVQGE